MTAPGSFVIAGPAGPLECLLKAPRGPARAVAVVCHPHPLYGGTMHNKVAYAIATALAEEGVAALRFNFRGVGLSAGSHGGGVGETDDLAAALDHVAREHPGLPAIVAGYSFGAWVGLRFGAVDPRIAALVGVGLATSIHGYEEVVTCVKPKLIVQGSADSLGPIAAVEALVARLAPPKELVVVAGADHFFAAGRDELRAAVGRFARGILG